MYIIDWQPKNPSPAPSGNGQPEESRMRHGHTISGHGNVPLAKKIGVKGEMDG